MLLVRGQGGGTELTGTIFERGEESPSYAGAPEVDAPYVWVCDSFYQVDSGGAALTVDGEELRIAFEEPAPRGFESRDRAIAAAKAHLRTQFSRVGIDSDTVDIAIEDAIESEVDETDTCE